MTRSSVDLLIPVHGAAPYLKECLASLTTIPINCHYDLTITFILDRCEDQVHDQIRSFRFHFPTKVLNSIRPGLVAALNLGLDKSKATYIARLDSDDLILPGRIGMQVEFLENNPNVAVVGGQSILINSIGQEVGITNLPCHPTSVKLSLLFSCPISHPTVMFHRNVIESYGGYSEKSVHCEDYDLWSRIAPCHLLANLNIPLIHYRQHQSQVSSKHRAVQKTCSHKVRLENLQRFKSISKFSDTTQDVNVSKFQSMIISCLYFLISITVNSSIVTRVAIGLTHYLDKLLLRYSKFRFPFN